MGLALTATILQHGEVIYKSMYQPLTVKEHVGQGYLPVITPQFLAIYGYYVSYYGQYPILSEFFSEVEQLILHMHLS